MDPGVFRTGVLMYAWRNGLLSRRTVALGAAVTIAIVVATYWPFWAGADTFDGIRNLGRPRFVASTTGSLVRLFGHTRQP